MLQRWFLHHVAPERSALEQERRLLWKRQEENRRKGKPQAGTGSGAPLPDNGTEEEQTMPEAQRRQTRKQRGNEEDIAEMTEERRRHILQHVPASLLTQYALGAAYLTDTLVSLLGEQELRALIRRTPECKGIDLSATADISALLDQAFAEESGRSTSLLSTLDTRTASQLIQVLETKIRQYEELQQAATTHLQKEERLAHAIDEREQKLSMANRTIDDWLRLSSTAEICSALGIVPPVPEAERNALIARIRGYLDTKRRLETWSMPEIGRNARLRDILEHGGSAEGAQKDVHEQLKRTLPILADVLRANLAEEAEQTRQWLENEKRKFGGDIAGIDPANHDEHEAAFLRAHGVSASAVAREVERIEAMVAFAEGEDVDARDPGTVINIAALCDQLRQTRETADGRTKDFLTDLQREQRIAASWARSLRAPLRDVLAVQYQSPEARERLERTFGLPDLFETLEQVQTDTADSAEGTPRVNAAEYPGPRRRTIEYLVRSLQSNRMVQTVQAAREIAEQERAVPETERTVQDTIAETRTRLEGVIGTLVAMPALQNGMAGILGVRAHVERRGTALEHAIATMEKEGKGDALPLVQTEIGKLEQAAAMLADVEKSTPAQLSEEAFRARTGTDHFAAYDYATGEILVNAGRCSREGEDVETHVSHEREHAVQDVLTRRAGIFPFLHRAAYEVLREDNADLDALLEGQAEAWGLSRQWETIERDAGDGADALKRELLTEELLNRYVDWKRSPEMIHPDAAEERLFAMVESANLVARLQGKTEDAAETGPTRASLRTLHLFQSRRGGGAAVADATAGTPATAEDNEEEEGGAKGPPNVKLELQKCQTKIFQLEQFAQAQPTYKGNLDELLPQYQEWHDELKDIFETQTTNGNPYPNPENQPEFQQQLAALKSDLDDLSGQARNIDNQLHDLSEKEPKLQGAFKAFWGNVAFLSPLDVYYLVQDAIEDVKRMWTRRSKQQRSIVAQGLFGNIPENDLPGLRYLGRLSRENEKREQQAEDEEVDVWKEGLKNKDAYQLMEILSGITTNKDQAKAILYLLAEKGRIDWGDKRIWRVLNRLSHFEMPETECDRDIVLRNNYLNKLIAEIWDDKDLFLDWKTTNDSNFNSNRDKFNEYVDSLSQNSGAMRAELERILRIFTTCKKSGEIPPQDVNPHLYEKIIEFAMVKGKMSMEDKFYYLIRGIAAGLLPLERLNILNNQVLGNFPFIDYFANQNNTLPEIKALADRITESGSGMQFRPGMKTTLFLQLDLARDESTRSRVTKVITRSGDKIDHEDAPMLMAFLDHGGINEMLQAYSGQLQRMTVEGVKNSYVGFSTLFKTYARVAALEQQGVARFTQQDALRLARSMMAFIHFDNIVMQAANDGKARQSMTWEQMENETMPSGDGRTPSEFRNPVGNLAVSLFHAYGIDRVEVGKKKVKDASGQEREEPAYVKIEDYLGALRGKRVMTKEQKQQLFDATQLFQRELLGAIAANPHVFAEVLRQNGDHMLQERSEEISTTSVGTALTEQKRQRAA